MKHHAKVLYVMVGGLSNFETLKQLLELAEEDQLEITLLDITSKVTFGARMSMTYMPPGEMRDAILRDRLTQLEALVSMIENGAPKLRARVTFGNRAKEIIRESEQGNYDLVIKHPEKGTTDNYVSRNCQCPVWVLEPEDYTESGEIKFANAPPVASKCQYSVPCEENLSAFSSVDPGCS